MTFYVFFRIFCYTGGLIGANFDGEWIHRTCDDQLRSWAVTARDRTTSNDMYDNLNIKLIKIDEGQHELFNRYTWTQLHEERKIHKLVGFF